MYYKEDWERAQQRYVAWWNNDILDRVALQVTAPKKDFIEKPVNQYTMLEKWTNPEIVLEMHERTFNKTFYGGESYPYIWVTLGPSIMGAYLGCELVFDETTQWTTWQKPCISGIHEFPQHKFTRNNKWYKIINEIIDLALEKGKDKYFVSVADIGASAEVLLHMLGAEKLCYDMIDLPNEVKSARDSIIDLWFELYDEMFYKIQKVMKGSCMWLSTWSPGKTYPLECDFSAMLSAKDFEEFFLPEIQRQCKFLDDAIYHLDGKEALQHLDLLLEIEELKAIQWCPGATAGANNTMLQWIPLIKKIQSKKKALHIEISKDEIEALLKEVSPNGLMLKTECNSEEEAKDLLKKVEKWSTAN